MYHKDSNIATYLSSKSLHLLSFASSPPLPFALASSSTKPRFLNSSGAIRFLHAQHVSMPHSSGGSRATHCTCPSCTAGTPSRAACTPGYSCRGAGGGTAGTASSRSCIRLCPCARDQSSHAFCRRVGVCTYHRGLVERNLSPDWFGTALSSACVLRFLCLTGGCQVSAYGIGFWTFCWPPGLPKVLIVGCPWLRTACAAPLWGRADPRCP